MLRQTTEDTHPSSRLRVLMVRTTLGEGGNDRVSATLLQELDRTRMEPELALLKVEGAFLGSVPGDVQIHSLGGVRLWRAVLPLTKLLRARQPDVLFSTSNGTNIVCALSHRLAQSRARLVLSERNATKRVEGSVKQSVLRRLKWLTYRRADVVTAVSQGVAAELPAFRVPEGRVKVVYNPVVTDDLESLAAQEVDHEWFFDDAPIVIGCGRLAPQKDFATLIRSLAEVRRSVPARLMILGDGNCEQDLRALAARLGIADSVCFAGFDINPFRYMARCHCFVLSSRHEGLPGALIQAMACGAAAVSTNCPYGPSEIIRHGVDGLLCDVGDSTTMAAHSAPGIEDSVATSVKVSSKRSGEGSQQRSNRSARCTFCSRGGTQVPCVRWNA